MINPFTEADARAAITANLARLGQKPEGIWSIDQLDIEACLVGLNAAIRSAASRTDGWVACPKEPTPGMVEAGWIDKEDVDPDDIYRAMIAAVFSAATADGLSMDQSGATYSVFLDLMDSDGTQIDEKAISLEQAASILKLPAHGLVSLGRQRLAQINDEHDEYVAKRRQRAAA